MRRLLLLFFTLISAAGALAQTAENQSLAGQPIEINSTGGTEYRDGLAIARDNVAIYIGDTDIYADHASYNVETKDVTVRGNVRIYHSRGLFIGDRAVYNTETRAINTENPRAADGPFFVGGSAIKSLDRTTNVERASFTTHDSAQPDFQIRATTVRIRENRYVVLRNATFYVGRVPIFYWPYIYQSLDDTFSFNVSPAYLTTWGASLLGRVTFPVTDNIRATLRVDYRARRGIALGLDPDITLPRGAGYVRIQSYVVQDENPTIDRTALPRETFPDERFRLALESRVNFTPDITAFARAQKLSDAWVLQDFFHSQFQLDPAPDNLLAVTKYDPNYSITGFARHQLNRFHEVTERLPEIAFDIKRQPLFGSPIFYEGEASLSNLKRNFPTRSFNEDYDALRLDTFHQLLYPQTYFGWLSVVPRVGGRLTYYSDTRDPGNVSYIPPANPLIPDFLLPPPNELEPLQRRGDRLRTVVNAGVETSFKISRTWEQAQSRAWGLDGLRHIIQPFANYSYVAGHNLSPAEILQFDRYQPSTQLRPIDFPQFTSIDSIASWSIARVGVRNRLQTRRDDNTINWLELDTYFDINFDNPYDRTDFSNVFNHLRFNPLPWASLGIYSQLPLLAEGFTEVNSEVGFKPLANVQLNFGHRFLDENPFFPNSSLYYASGYVRLNDHWGAGAYVRYEARTGFVEEQRYAIYRDLTSWVASLGAIVRNNRGEKEYGMLLSFSLKALPKFSFDLNFDPGAEAFGGSAGGMAVPTGREP
jgi:LPS-assembly protein